MELRERAESDFGQRIRVERTSRDWSQDELARRLTERGVTTHASTVAKIESPGRKPRAVRLAEASALADLFGVSVDELLGRTPGMPDDLEIARVWLARIAVQAHVFLPRLEAWLAEGVMRLERVDPENHTEALRSLCDEAREHLALAERALTVARALPEPEMVNDPRS